MGNFFKIKNSKIPYWIWLILLTLLSLVIFGLFTKDLPSVDLSNESKGITSNIRNVAYYFFSTISQTIGALVAIVLTFFFTILNSFRANENLYANVLRRRLLKDRFLRFSLLLCLLAVLISILSLSFSGSNTFSINSFNLIGSVVILLVISGIYLFVLFILIRASLYNNPKELLSFDLNHDRKAISQISLGDIIDSEVIRCLLASEDQINTTEYLKELKGSLEAYILKEADYYNAIKEISELVSKSFQSCTTKRKDSSVYHNLYKYIFKSNVFLSYENKMFYSDNDYKNHIYMNEAILLMIVKNVDFDIIIEDIKYLIDSICEPHQKNHYSFDCNIKLQKYSGSYAPLENFYDFWVSFIFEVIKFNKKYTVLLSSFFFIRLRDSLNRSQIEYYNNPTTRDQETINNYITNSILLFWYSLFFEISDSSSNRSIKYFKEMLGFFKSKFSDELIFLKIINENKSFEIDVLSDICMRIINEIPLTLTLFYRVFSNKMEEELENIVTQSPNQTFSFNGSSIKFDYTRYKNNSSNERYYFSFGYYFPFMEYYYIKNNKRSYNPDDEMNLLLDIVDYLTNIQNKNNIHEFVNIDDFKSGYLIRRCLERRY